MLSVLEPPVGVLGKIQVKMIHLFWDRLHWLPRNVLYLPKEEGGQGVVDLISRKVAFRLQFVQNILYSPNIFGLFFGTQRRRSHFFHSLSSPLFSLLARLSRIIYWETLSARLSKLKDYGFDQLVSQRNWHYLGSGEPVCPDGTFAAGYTMDAWETWRNRMSSGSFRGGHWRYLPIRNHDNRYFADWIRLCPGL